MNTIISIAIGATVYIALLWLLLAVMRLEKCAEDDDDEEDGAQAEANIARIVEATQPAPLEPERRHVRAGTAYGVDL
jgi:hypothetical protein